MTDVDTRKLLRQQLRKARNQLTTHEQQAASLGLLAQLSTLEPVLNATSLAGYLSNDGEPSLIPMIEHCWQHQLTFTVPVIHPFNPKSLLFLRYQPDSEITHNRFGIPEPVLACPAVQPLLAHDVILLPLVGFDSAGNRLGMGGGFYDRTLANVHLYQQRPILIGVAHDCQQVDTLPVELWDVPLDFIVTPTKVIKA